MASSSPSRPTVHHPLDPLILLAKWYISRFLGFDVDGTNNVFHPILSASLAYTITGSLHVILAIPRPTTPSCFLPIVIVYAEGD